MAFEGSCHCGAVKYSVEGIPPTSAMSCNCSHCRRKGFLLAFIPRDAFTLQSGADDLREYTFNKHKIKHQFCATCGTEAFAYGSNPDGSPVVALNLRCVPAIDPVKLKVQEYDGASA